MKFKVGDTVKTISNVVFWEYEIPLGLIGKITKIFNVQDFPYLVTFENNKDGLRFEESELKLANKGFKSYATWTENNDLFLTNFQNGVRLLDIKEAEEFANWILNTLPKKVFKVSKILDKIPTEIIIDGDRYFTEDFQIDEEWE